MDFIVSYKQRNHQVAKAMYGVASWYTLPPEVCRGKFSSAAVFATILAAVLDTALMFANSYSKIG